GGCLSGTLRGTLRPGDRFPSAARLTISWAKSSRCSLESSSCLQHSLLGSLASAGSSRASCHRPLRNRSVRWNLLEGEPVKINIHEFNEYVGGRSHGDPAVRQKSVSGLAKYSSAEWQGTSGAITDAVAALVNASRFRAATARDGAFRAEAAKVLGNTGT